MKELTPLPPILDPAADPNRRGYLTDAQAQINVDHSIVDPKQVLGIRSNRNDQVSVPAVFEMPSGESGETSRFALVRYESSAGEDKIALHGLRRTRNGWRASRKGVAIEPAADGPTEIVVGNRGNVSYRQLYGWRGRKGSFATGDDGLRLVISPEGNVLASSTADAPVVRMNTEELTSSKVQGRVRVDANTPPLPGLPRHAEYRTPEERHQEALQAEAERRTNQERREAAERKRVHDVFAPNPEVPDTTKGERVPPGYDGAVVTQKSRDFSRKWLEEVALDREVVGAFQEETGLLFDLGQSDTLMDSIRTNDGLRQRLAQIYSQRIFKKLHLMGDNIRFLDRWKKPNFGGYKGKQMRPYEYAALLAICHIDGTFNPEREHVFGEKGEVNEFGWPILDQHRAAARYALDPYKSSY